jgi:hypothetical protein
MCYYNWLDLTGTLELECQILTIVWELNQCFLQKLAVQQLKDMNEENEKIKLDLKSMNTCRTVQIYVIKSFLIFTIHQEAC